jgi:hypothetical protein
MRRAISFNEQSLAGTSSRREGVALAARAADTGAEMFRAKEALDLPSGEVPLVASFQ